MTVAELMSDRLITLHKGESLEDAEQYFRLGHIRHLPVVQGNKLVGLLTQRDLVGALVGKARQDAWKVLVGDVMTKDVDTLPPDASAKQATAMMLDNKYGCIPIVTGEGTLVGILTETDLLRFAAERIDELERREQAASYDADA